MSLLGNLVHGYRAPNPRPTSTVNPRKVGYYVDSLASDAEDYLAGNLDSRYDYKYFLFTVRNARVQAALGKYGMIDQAEFRGRLHSNIDNMLMDNGLSTIFRQEPGLSLENPLHIMRIQPDFQDAMIAHEITVDDHIVVFRSLRYIPQPEDFMNVQEPSRT